MLNLIKHLFRSCIFMWPYVKQHTVKFTISVILMFVVSGATASYAYLVKEILDRVFIEKDQRMLYLLPFAIIATTVIKNTALFFQTQIMQVIMSKITLRMQSEMYKKYIHSDIKYFDNTSTSKMVNRMMMVTSSIADGINNIIIVAIREFFTIIGLMVVLFIQSPVLTLMSLISFPMTVIPVVVISKRLREAMHSNQTGAEDLMAQVDESLKAPRVVKSNIAEDLEIERTNKIFVSILKLRRKMITLSSALPSINESISIIGIAIVVWYGGVSVIGGNMTSGEFFAFFTAMTIAYKPLKSLSRLSITIQHFNMSVGIIKEELEMPVTIVDKPNAIELKDIKGEIEFHGVSFSYNESQPVLKDISFKIEAGKTLAIVGPTGSGKSTIIALLERFYEPSQGIITIDGHDISNIKLQSLRGAMSLVSQDIQLFNDTIENNIRYTKTDATYEEIVRAAELANATEFIDKLENGYRTFVGQSGVKLSGGQKQRLAIARAILYNGSILLLDEATSALDSISEKLIKDALDKFMKGKTTIAIAHRLSTIINADQILVMKHGEIVEHGTHRELLENSKHYRVLYDAQAKGL